MDKLSSRARSTNDRTTGRNSYANKTQLRSSVSTNNVISAKKSQNWTRNSVVSNQGFRPSIGVNNRTSLASAKNPRVPSHKRKASKKSIKNFEPSERLTSPESSPDSSDPGNVLRLPRKVRLKIWNDLSLADQLILRLTCSIVKRDIDNFIGVKVELDDVDESFPHLIKIGIQSAAILDLPSVAGKFLSYPELLKELTIVGGIKTSCFVTLMRDCLNLVHLSIQFTKDLLAIKPRLFPVSINDKTIVNVLPHLKYVEFQSTTKSDGELEYVQKNFVGLVNTHLLDRIHPHSLRVTIVHKFYNDIIEECSKLMATLVHNNMRTLRDLEVDIKYLTSMGVPDEGENPSSNADDDSDYLAAFFEAEECSEDEDSKEPEWGSFPNLKNLHFSTNPKDFQCYWKEMPNHISSLETLYCEIHSPISWDFYRSFIRGCESTLETIILESAYYFDTRRRPRPIDLGVFKKCKNLESLFISQGRHHGMINSSIKNISKLPSSVEELELEYLILTPRQVLQLLRTPQLHHLRIGYWSVTDKSFGRLLCLLRWVLACSCTSINEFIIVDLKIRFQHNKKSLQVLLKHRILRTDYTDFNETMLILRRKGTK